MSNYVRNYVFCNPELSRALTGQNPKNRMLSCGVYNLEVVKINDKRWFVLFETRGQEYEAELITSIINRFKDTIWYCIEENNIEQGEFGFDGENVYMDIRSLTEPWDDCLITISYTDKYLRPLLAAFVFPEEIVVEQYIQNKMIKVPLDKNSSSKIKSFVDHKFDQLIVGKNGFKEYTLSEENEVWEQCWIRKAGTNSYILIENGGPELYQEGDPESGELLMAEIKCLIEKVCLANGVSSTFSYKQLKEFL